MSQGVDVSVGCVVDELESSQVVEISVVVSVVVSHGVVVSVVDELESPQVVEVSVEVSVVKVVVVESVDSHGGVEVVVEELDVVEQDVLSMEVELSVVEDVVVDVQILTGGFGPCGPCHL